MVSDAHIYTKKCNCWALKSCLGIHKLYQGRPIHYIILFYNILLVLELSIVKIILLEVPHNNI